MCCASRVLATWLFYLAEDILPRTWARNFILKSSAEYSLRLFFLTQPHLSKGVEVEHAKAIEFHPNQLVAFAIGPYTFDGGSLSVPPASMIRRMSMNNNIEISKDAMPRAFHDVPRELFDLH